MTADQIPADRCKKQNFRTKTQCHHSIHGDELNAISPSTAKTTTSVLTPKQIISLAGLDDIATTYGYENFLEILANLKELQWQTINGTDNFFCVRCSCDRSGKFL